MASDDFSGVIVQANINELQATAKASAFMVAEMWAHLFGVPEELGIARFNYLRSAILTKHPFPPEMKEEFQKHSAESLEVLQRLTSGMEKEQAEKMASLPWKKSQSPR